MKSWNKIFIFIGLNFYNLIIVLFPTRLDAIKCFQKLIAELRTKAVVHYIKDIEWANEKVAVTNDNVKNLLQALEQFDHELAQTTIHEDKVFFVTLLLIIQHT